jgi:hypothetical protein
MEEGFHEGDEVLMSKSNLLRKYGSIKVSEARDATSKKIFL